MAYVPDIIPPDESARYVKGNMGTRVGFGARPAILVVDMTRPFTGVRFPLGCVRATVVDAFSHNYRVIVPIECVADRSLTSHQVNLFDMDMKYADVVPLAEVLNHLARG